MSSGSSAASSASAVSHWSLGSGWDQNDGSGVVPGAQHDSEHCRRRASLIILDRKRRLTAGSEDTVRRPPAQAGDGDPGPSTSRLNIHRPLPSLPTNNRDDVLLVNSASGPPRQPTVVDSLASTPLLESLSHSLSYHSPPLSRQREDFMEYILPQWQPDAEVTHCPICGIQFNFWYRKHHCRKCGRVVCAACSPHRITIPRQFIVRPSAAQGRPASAVAPPTTGAPHGVDRTGTDAQLALMLGLGDLPLSPALGGGEEVRLCNPCVPDPNPDPPIGYRTLQSSLDRISDPGWETSRLSAFPPFHSGREHQRSVSAAAGGSSQTDLGRELRRHHGQSMMFPTSRAGPRPGATTHSFMPYGPSSGFSGPQFGGYPPRYQFTPEPLLPSHSPPAYSSPLPTHMNTVHFSRPHGIGFRDGGAGTSTMRSARGQALDSQRPRHSSQPSRPSLFDDRDVCPICNRLLPPRGAGGDESARETHIRDCIERHGRRARSPSSSAVGGEPGSPRGAPAMRIFAATEKDCLGEDGSTQECTICMEEYEVGAALVRLECLCKFHQTCIVEWFERKQECPVHKRT